MDHSAPEMRLGENRTMVIADKGNELESGPIIDAVEKHLPNNVRACFAAVSYSGAIGAEAPCRIHTAPSGEVEAAARIRDAKWIRQ